MAYIDVKNIFQEKAGRAPTSDELLDLSGKYPELRMGVYTNEAALTSDIQQYAENKKNVITPLQENPPLISSGDSLQKYTDNSGKVDTYLSGQELANKQRANTPITIDTRPQNEQITPIEDIKPSGDAAYDSYRRASGELQTRANKENALAEQNRAEREQLYTTSLAAIDQTARATVNNINSTYDRILTEQRRINQINIDRVKAYGLAGGGRFMPVGFQDSISNREYEAANKISEHENQRNNLIAQAKMARDNGQARLLGEKLDAIDKIDAQLRNSLQGVQESAQKQWQALQEYRTAQEKAQKEARQEALRQFALLASGYAGQYDALSPQDKDSFISKIVARYGTNYADVYGILENAVAKQQTESVQKQKNKLDIQKQELGIKKGQLDLLGGAADIQAKEALTKERDASARAADALAYSRYQADKKTPDKKTPDKKTSTTGDDTGDIAKNIIAGATRLSDLTSTERQKATTDLRKLGFYNGAPPRWYIEAKNEEAGQTLLPEDVARAWEEYRKEITAEEV